MTEPHRLMAVLAHPDDESLAIGGTLARCDALRGTQTFYRALGLVDVGRGVESDLFAV